MPTTLFRGIFQCSYSTRINRKLIFWSAREPINYGKDDRLKWVFPTYHEVLAALQEVSRKWIESFPSLHERRWYRYILSTESTVHWNMFHWRDGGGGGGVTLNNAVKLVELSNSGPLWALPKRRRDTVLMSPLVSGVADTSGMSSKIFYWT
jgi:hypothetical protein